MPPPFGRRHDDQCPLRRCRRGHCTPLWRGKRPVPSGLGVFHTSLRKRFRRNGFAISARSPRRSADGDGTPLECRGPPERPSARRSMRGIFPAAHVAGKNDLNLSASGGNQEGTPVPSWTFPRTLDGGRRSPSNCLLLTLLPAIRLAAKRHRRRRAATAAGRGTGAISPLRARAPQSAPPLLSAEHLPAGPRLPCAKGAGTAKGRD